MNMLLPILCAVFFVSQACADGGDGATSAGSAANGGPRPMHDSVFYSNNIRAVTAVTEVFGGGQRTTAAIVEFGQPIKSSDLTNATFSVIGRKVTKIYASDHPDKAGVGNDGRFVIVELDPNDANASTYNPQGPILNQASVVVNQVGMVNAVGGESFSPTSKPIASTRQANLIMDDFQQFRFNDPVTGLALTYNLYIPKNYDPHKKYPLLLFMHDLGVTGLNPYATLAQGLGAIAFASAEDQAKHPAFILAPQYPVALANDSSQTSDYADITVRLIKALTDKYGIDNNRLYATGQSGGCMTSIALNVKYPDLFAASLLVAGQWDASKVAPMAHNRLWIIVSQDDQKAFPGMNAITAELQKAGAKITSAVWDGTSSPAQFKAAFDSVLNAGPDSNVYYVSFKKGTVIPAGESTQGAAGHVNTWRVAYTIESVRDWLFQQHKQD